MRSMGIPLKMNGLIYKVTSLRSRQIYVLTLTIRMTHWMSPIVVLQKTSEQIYISPSHVIFWISAIYVQHTWNIILWKIKCIQLKQHHFEYMLICIHAYVYTYTCKKIYIYYMRKMPKRKPTCIQRPSIVLKFCGPLKSPAPSCLVSLIMIVLF